MASTKYPARLTERSEEFPGKYKEVSRSFYSAVMAVLRCLWEGRCYTDVHKYSWGFWIPRLLESMSQKHPHSPTSIVSDFSTFQKKSIQKRFVSYTRESSLANTVSDTIERISSKYLIFSHRINFHISKIWKT